MFGRAGEASGDLARIGRVTGEGIAGNLRARYPPWLLRGIVALLLVANILKLGADLGAMGAATHLHVAGSAQFYVVIFAAGAREYRRMADEAAAPDLAKLYRRLGAALDKEAEDAEKGNNKGPS